MLKQYVPDDDPNTPKYRFWLTEQPVFKEYVVKAPFRDSVRAWCKENCQGHYLVGLQFIDFELEEDYVLASMYYS